MLELLSALLNWLPRFHWRKEPPIPNFVDDHKEILKLKAAWNICATARWETDQDMRCVWVNAALCRLAGRTQQEFLGLDWRTILHPDDTDEVMKEVESAHAERRSYVVQFRFRTANGKDVWCESMGVPIYDRSSKVMYGWFGETRKIKPTFKKGVVK